MSTTTGNMDQMSADTEPSLLPPYAPAIASTTETFPAFQEFPLEVRNSEF